MGFIVGPLISGFLSVYGFSVPGFAAVALAALNFLFVFLFLPESTHRALSGSSRESMFSTAYLRGLVDAFSKPLIGSTLAVSFATTTAFSAIPVILPLLAIAYYGFGPAELSYTFVYLGAVQILLQGIVIGRLSERIGEEKLLAFGPLSMMLGMVVMPLIPNIAVLLMSVTLIGLGSGIMQTVVPSFLSSRTPEDEQGEVLGVAQSVSSVGYVPGPLIGGALFQLGGPVVAFLASAAMLASAFVLGCRIFRACMIKNSSLSGKQMSGTDGPK